MAHITWHHYNHVRIPPEVNEQVWVDLDHNESQSIGNAGELDAVAGILGSLAGAGPYSAFVVAEVYALRRDIRDRDRGDGVRVVLTYWLAPVFGRQDRDVQTGHPDVPG